ARSRPEAAPQSTAPHRLPELPPEGCRPSRGEERSRSSRGAFHWMNLQGSLLLIPGTYFSRPPPPIMGQNDRRSPTMNPAFLPRALTATLLALLAAVAPVRGQTLD